MPNARTTEEHENTLLPWSVKFNQPHVAISQGRIERFRIQIDHPLRFGSGGGGDEGRGAPRKNGAEENQRGEVRQATNPRHRVPASGCRW